MLDLKQMSKKDRKEYKKLLKLEKFLNKKIKKMEKTVNLYEKTNQIVNIHLCNAKRKIEIKYLWNWNEKITM